MSSAPTRCRVQAKHWLRSPSRASTSWTSACDRVWPGPRFPIPRFSASKALGRVLAVGDGVEGIAPGQRVAWVYAPGSYAQRIALPAASLVPVPDAIDDRIGGLRDDAGPNREPFRNRLLSRAARRHRLVHAAAGGVGLLLTQIIKLRGGHVIGRVSSEEKVAAAKEAGADHVIVDPEGRFADEVLRLTQGEGVHVVYDGSGPTTFQGSLDALRRSGTFCWYGPVLGGPGPLDIMSLPKSIKIGYAVFFDHIHTPELLRAHSAQLFDWTPLPPPRLPRPLLPRACASAAPHRSPPSPPPGRLKRVGVCSALANLPHAVSRELRVLASIFNHRISYLFRPARVPPNRLLPAPARSPPLSFFLRSSSCFLSSVPPRFFPAPSSFLSFPVPAISSRVSVRWFDLCVAALGCPSCPRALSRVSIAPRGSAIAPPAADSLLCPFPDACARAPAPAGVVRPRSPASGRARSVPPPACSLFSLLPLPCPLPVLSQSPIRSPTPSRGT